MTDRICSVDDCERPAKARGWCSTHYNRWKATGDPGDYIRRTSPQAPRPIPWDKVDKSGPGGCWIWRGTIDGGGYGRLYRQRKTLATHRFFYELVVGPIPAGLELDHLCCVKACCNPSHLEPVTNAENIARYQAIATGGIHKTHCMHGHEFTEENTYLYHGRRSCRTCRDDASRRRREKRRRSRLWVGESA